MGAIRVAATVLASGLAVPVFSSALQFSAIGLSNGHWTAPLGALPHGLSMLPLAIIAAPVNVAGAALVAGFSLGLQALIGWRSLLIWIAHGAIVGVLELMWLFPYSRPALVVLGVLGSWTLASAAMWFFLARRP